MSSDSQSALLDRLHPLFEDTFPDSDFVLSLDTSREDIEEWDSLGQIRLLSAIEEEFDFEFDIDEIERLSDVRTMVEIINTQLGG